MWLVSVRSTHKNTGETAAAGGQRTYILDEDFCEWGTTVVKSQDLPGYEQVRDSPLHSENICHAFFSQA